MGDFHSLEYLIHPLNLDYQILSIEMDYSHSRPKKTPIKQHSVTPKRTKTY